MIAQTANGAERDYSDSQLSDEYYDQDQGKDATGTGDVNKQKHRRRSKNDNEGRTYVCGCGKSYLSYPALYTHIKQKHGTAPDGTNNAQHNTGRGRGRPRKQRPVNFAGEVVTLAD